MRRHRWALLGRSGAVQLVLWEYLPGTDMHSILALSPLVSRTADGSVWQPVDVGYHSPRSMFDGQEQQSGCDILEGECWYDGSTLNALDLLDRLVVEGKIQEEFIWPYLEDYYREVFQ